MHTVIFDLDGTLADTSGDLIAAANAALSARGLGAPLDPVRDAATAFRGGRAMLRLGYARAGRALEGTPESDADFQAFLDHYADHIDVVTRLYPGVEAALDGLLEGGYRLGVCTNKPAGLAEDLLAKLRIRDRFGSMIGADTLPVRKPDPAPYRAAVEGAGGLIGQSLLLGDTDTDRQTARAAGVPSVLVTFGPDGHDVAALDPEALLHHFDELADVVARLIGRPA